MANHQTMFKSTFNCRRSRAEEERRQGRVSDRLQRLDHLRPGSERATTGAVNQSASEISYREKFRKFLAEKKRAKLEQKQPVRPFNSAVTKGRFVEPVGGPSRRDRATEKPFVIVGGCAPGFNFVLGMVTSTAVKRNRPLDGRLSPPIATPIFGNSPARNFQDMQEDGNTGAAVEVQPSASSTVYFSAVEGDGEAQMSGETLHDAQPDGSTEEVQPVEIHSSAADNVERTEQAEEGFIQHLQSEMGQQSDHLIKIIGKWIVFKREKNVTNSFLKQITAANEQANYVISIRFAEIRKLIAKFLVANGDPVAFVELAERWDTIFSEVRTCHETFQRLDAMKSNELAKRSEANDNKRLGGPRNMGTFGSNSSRALHHMLSVAHKNYLKIKAAREAHGSDSDDE